MTSTTEQPSSHMLLQHSSINNNILQPSSKHDINKAKNSAAALEFIRHHHSVKKPQTPSVSRRNARERNRVKLVNNGFCTLRTHIPHLKSKTSKVDTLRAAVDYIRNLRKLLGEEMSAEEEERSREMSFNLGDLEDEPGSSSPLPPSNPPSPALHSGHSLPPPQQSCLPPQNDSNASSPTNNNVLQMVFSLPNEYAPGMGCQGGNNASHLQSVMSVESPDLLSSMGFDSSVSWYALPDEGFKHEI